MSEITDVFFDLDHTLWDFDKNSGLAFNRVFKKHGVPITLTEFMQIYEPINFEYWKAYREERIDKLGLRRGRLVDAFAKFQMNYDLAEIDAMAQSYIEELPVDNHLLDGALEVLEYLKPNYTLHIITNGFIEVQDKKLKASGIAPYFETVTASEEVGVKKPNVLVFEKALRKAGALAQKSLMIGDTFEAD
ncbi:MAG: YjjG family noncanonical pyrimidine nucleotidase, partial [Marinirhabdus sp.]|nr:YjjG family noncanonical pyrimidine nucleotidase [Marinirhabdus sp.]